MNNRPIFYFSLSGLLGEGHYAMHLYNKRQTNLKVNIKNITDDRRRKNA
jgi:hypothetical protein